MAKLGPAMVSKVVAVSAMMLRENTISFSLIFSVWTPWLGDRMFSPVHTQAIAGKCQAKAKFRTTRTRTRGLRLRLLGPLALQDHWYRESHHGKGYGGLALSDFGHRFDVRGCWPSAISGL